FLGPVQFSAARYRIRQREICRGRRASNVNVVGGIDGDLRTTLIWRGPRCWTYLAASAEVGGIGQDGVNHQLAGVVVGADGESDSVIGKLPETSRNRLLVVRPLGVRTLGARAGLINMRRLEANVSASA